MSEPNNNSDSWASNVINDLFGSQYYNPRVMVDDSSEYVSQKAQSKPFAAESLFQQGDCETSQNFTEESESLNRSEDLKSFENCIASKSLLKKSNPFDDMTLFQQRCSKTSRKFTEESESLNRSEDFKSFEDCVTPKSQMTNTNPFADVHFFQQGKSAEHFNEFKSFENCVTFIPQMAKSKSFADVSLFQQTDREISEKLTKVSGSLGNFKKVENCVTKNYQQTNSKSLPGLILFQQGDCDTSQNLSVEPEGHEHSDNYKSFENFMTPKSYLKEIFELKVKNKYSFCKVYEHLLHSNIDYYLTGDFNLHNSIEIPKHERDRKWEYLDLDINSKNVKRICTAHLKRIRKYGIKIERINQYFELIAGKYLHIFVTLMVKIYDVAQVIITLFFIGLYTVFVCSVNIIDLLFILLKTITESFLCDDINEQLNSSLTIKEELKLENEVDYEDSADLNLYVVKPTEISDDEILENYTDVASQIDMNQVVEFKNTHALESHKKLQLKESYSEENPHLDMVKGINKWIRSYSSCDFKRGTSTPMRHRLNIAPYSVPFDLNYLSHCESINIGDSPLAIKQLEKKSPEFLISAKDISELSICRISCEELQALHNSFIYLNRMTKVERTLDPDLPSLEQLDNGDYGGNEEYKDSCSKSGTVEDSLTIKKVMPNLEQLDNWVCGSAQAHNSSAFEFVEDCMVTRKDSAVSNMKRDEILSSIQSIAVSNSSSQSLNSSLDVNYSFDSLMLRSSLSTGLDLSTKSSRNLNSNRSISLGNVDPNRQWDTPTKLDVRSPSRRQATPIEDVTGLLLNSLSLDVTNDYLDEPQQQNVQVPCGSKRFAASASLRKKILALEKVFTLHKNTNKKHYFSSNKSASFSSSDSKLESSDSDIFSCESYEILSDLRTDNQDESFCSNTVEENVEDGPSVKKKMAVRFRVISFFRNFKGFRLPRSSISPRRKKYERCGD